MKGLPEIASANKIFSEQWLGVKFFVVFHRDMFKEINVLCRLNTDKKRLINLSLRLIRLCVSKI